MAKHVIARAPQNEAAKNLPVRVFEASVRFGQSRRLFRPKGYFLYQIMQCASGKGRFWSAEKSYEIETGDIVYFEPGIPHGYEPLGEEPWLLDWVSFDGTGMEKMKGLLSEEGSLVLKGDRCGSLKQGIEKIMIVLADGSFGGQLLASSAVYDMAAKLAVWASDPDYTTKMTRLEPVVEYMEEHLSEPFEIDSLARLIRVSPSYLCRLFLKVYHTTPVRYGNNLKLIRAADLLMENPDMKVKEAAAALGYQDVSWFCREFRKFYSVTPAAYRRYYRGRGSC